MWVAKNIQYLYYTDQNHCRQAATLANQFEAQLLESILREQEIPHLMRCYYDTALGGLFQTLKGG